MSNKHLFSTLLACFLLLVGSQNIQAQDYPASPLEKEGYRLIFHDEFEGKEIDRTKWIPEYLPSWPKDRTVCTPTYEMKDGVVRLTIDRDSKNEFDKGMYISGFMSASRTGMHHYDPKRKALHSIKTEATQINQYGYYEMRAKMQAGGGVHCAWWLIGFEDDPNQSCEIDIFEILGTDVNRIWSTVHSWKDSTIQYHTEHPWFANKKLAEEFHVYGFDWTPEGVTVYVDGIRVSLFMTIGKRKTAGQGLTILPSRIRRVSISTISACTRRYPKAVRQYRKMSYASFLSSRHACRYPKEKLPCAILTDM